MAVARVVSFEGVSAARMEELRGEIEGGEQPDEIPAKEILALHNPETEESLVLLLFDSDADYERGDAALNAMPAADTPGRRTSVAKYNVALRMTR